MRSARMIAGALLVPVIAAVIALGAAPLEAAGEHKVEALETRLSAQAGKYLTDGQGRALYVFSAESGGEGGARSEAKCRDACATAWPPATAERPPGARNGADPGLVSLVPRNGKQQLAYDGRRLYYFVGDSGRGQATGHGVKEFGGTWYLASAEGGPAREKAAGWNPFRDLALKGPECVRHDAQRGRYLVSNINGKMTAADNNGFITRVGPDGMSDLKWIGGGKNGVTLNAPKGMELAGGTLHVADIDHLRMFDAGTGEPTGSIRIDGARFLNDLAIAEDGTVYVTDSGTKDVPGAVYRVAPDGSYRAIAEGRDLKRPNGIDFDADGRLVVVTFGADEVLTMSTAGEIVQRRKLDAGQLDGLIVMQDGTSLVSSWKGKHVVRLRPDGTAETVLTGVSKPAAFEMDAERGVLIVPEVRENRIVVAALPSE